MPPRGGAWCADRAVPGFVTFDGTVYNQLCKTLLLSFHWCRLFHSLHGLPSAVSARQPQYMIGKIIFNGGVGFTAD